MDSCKSCRGTKFIGYVKEFLLFTEDSRKSFFIKIKKVWNLSLVYTNNRYMRNCGTLKIFTCMFLLGNIESKNARR